MQATITAEHAWLRHFVGDWETRSATDDADPNSPPAHESFRMLGDAWVIGDQEFLMGPDQLGLAILSLGFDPVKGKFVGTFIGSMMNHLWVYEGSLAGDGDTLVLDCTGPKFDGSEGLGQYQDIYQRIDDNTRMLTSRALGDDGEWVTFMVNRSVRVRP